LLGTTGPGFLAEARSLPAESRYCDSAIANDLWHLRPRWGVLALDALVRARFED